VAMRWECDVCGCARGGPRPLHCRECGLAGTYVRADARADGDELRQVLFSIGFRADRHPILTGADHGPSVRLW